jgi:hypothetical protein
MHARTTGPRAALAPVEKQDRHRRACSSVRAGVPWGLPAFESLRSKSLTICLLYEDLRAEPVVLWPRKVDLRRTQRADGPLGRDAEQLALEAAREEREADRAHVPGPVGGR